MPTLLHALVPLQHMQEDTAGAMWTCPCGEPVGWVPDWCTPEDCGEPDCDGTSYRWVEHVIATGITPPDLHICIPCIEASDPNPLVNNPEECYINARHHHATRRELTR